MMFRNRVINNFPIKFSIHPEPLVKLRRALSKDVEKFPDTAATRRDEICNPVPTV